jgi:hypothetical protein
VQPGEYKIILAPQPDGTAQFQITAPDVQGGADPRANLLRVLSECVLVVANAPSQPASPIAIPGADLARQLVK